MVLKLKNVFITPLGVVSQRYIEVAVVFFLYISYGMLLVLLLLVFGAFLYDGNLFSV